MLKQRLCSLLVLLSLSCSSVAIAQIRSATITGIVTDPQKAVVPGATVVLTNEATNVAAEFVTTDAGLFTAPLLQAGTYTVTVSLAGFATFKRTGVAVGATETVRIPVELIVSQLGETVDVTADAPLLQTDRSSVSGAVGAEMIEALPNITPRIPSPTPTSRPVRCRASRPAIPRASTRSASASTAAGSSRRSASTADARSPTTFSSTGSR